MDTVFERMSKESDASRVPDHEFQPLILEDSHFHPSRLEYLASKIVQGMMTNTPKERYNAAIKDSVMLAALMEKALDEAQAD